MRLRPLTIPLALTAALAANAARADVIDGAWCHDQHGRVIIQGPSVVTPTGARTQGDYTRHSFSYVAPAGDPGAGATIQMMLLNEETVRVRNGANEETWRRCGPSIS